MQAHTRTRRTQLMDLLRQDSVLSIRYLSEHLAVSPLTIRRDLDELQKEGVVERLHGGARRLPSTRQMDKHEISFFVRQDVNVNEKRAIARAALPFLEQDQVIFLDASTTVLCVAEAMPEDISLTIVTHSAYLPIKLTGHPNLQVICTGGLLHARSLCYLGAEAENRVLRLSARRAFLGVKGFSLEEGCTDANLLEVQLKGLMVQRANELFVLADHTKLGNIALSAFATLKQVHTLISDEGADPRLVESLRSQGIRVILAPLG